LPFNDADTNIDTEIDKWRKFGDAFRQENRELFEKMMHEARNYNLAFAGASNKDPAEALLMVLILHQQKIITKLIGELKRKPL
jgi:hypothetical protein